MVSDWRNSIQYLQNAVERICQCEVVKAYCSWNILSTINIIFNHYLVKLHSLYSFVIVFRTEVVFDIWKGMWSDFVIIRETIDTSSMEVDEHIVVVLNTVLVCWRRCRFSLKISPADETSVNIGRRHFKAAHFLEIEIEDLPFYCAQVRALFQLIVL